MKCPCYMLRRLTSPPTAHRHTIRDKVQIFRMNLNREWLRVCVSCCARTLINYLTRPPPAFIYVRNVCKYFYHLRKVGKCKLESFCVAGILSFLYLQFVCTTEFATCRIWIKCGTNRDSFEVFFYDVKIRNCLTM